VGYDVDKNLSSIIENEIDAIDIDKYNSIIKNRYDNHLEFVRSRESLDKEIKHYNNNFKCKVMTGQETDMSFDYLSAINKVNSNNLTYEVEYLKETNIDELPFITKGTLF
jgi:hypothetical protein